VAVIAVFEGLGDKARLISRIDTTPSYGVEEGVLWKPKVIIFCCWIFSTINQEIKKEFCW